MTNILGCAIFNQRKDTDPTKLITSGFSTHGQRDIDEKTVEGGEIE